MKIENNFAGALQPQNCAGSAVESKLCNPPSSLLSSNRFAVLADSSPDLANAGDAVQCQKPNAFAAQVEQHVQTIGIDTAQVGCVTDQQSFKNVQTQTLPKSRAHKRMVCQVNVLADHWHPPVSESLQEVPGSLSKPSVRARTEHSSRDNDSPNLPKTQENRQLVPFKVCDLEPPVVVNLNDVCKFEAKASEGEASTLQANSSSCPTNHLQTLVEKVKRFQRESWKGHDKWLTFCKRQRQSIRDPARHSEGFLQRFLTEHDDSAPSSVLPNCPETECFIDGGVSRPSQHPVAYKYKTQECAYYVLGRCNKGVDCTYAHSKLPTQAAPSDKHWKPSETISQNSHTSQSSMHGNSRLPMRSGKVGPRNLPSQLSGHGQSACSLTALRTDLRPRWLPRAGSSDSLSK